MRQAAGVLVYRRRGDALEVLLVHPGGPLWAKKDVGAWTIPKGEHGDDEAPLDAARRELAEETGLVLPGTYRPLGEIVQRGGKRVRAWAVEGDFDPGALVSNTVEIEWPPRSGRRRVVPEVDRAAWFPLEEAREKINVAQRAFLERLLGLC